MRYHTPFIISQLTLLTQTKEQLEIECSKAWIQFLKLLFFFIKKKIFLIVILINIIYHLIILFNS